MPCTSCQAGAGESSAAAAAAPGTRRRGRPKGSRNKPKAPPTAVDGGEPVAPAPAREVTPPPPSALAAVSKVERAGATGATVVEFVAILYAPDWDRRLRLSERFAAGIWSLLPDTFLMRESDEHGAWEVAISRSNTFGDCFLMGG